MGDGLKKAFVIIGGLLIGVGVTYMARMLSGDILMLSDEMWIAVGLVVTIFAAASLHFMGKGSG